MRAHETWSLSYQNFEQSALHPIARLSHFPIGTRGGLTMAELPLEAGEPADVETFGVLELRLSSGNSTGYCDVYPLKDRKKKPFQAKIYRPWRKDFITIGTFASAHEAAVAVAQQRLEGIEDFPSPDKSRAENSTLPRPASYLQCLLLLISLLFVSRAEREAKACCGDGHRHSDAYYNSNIRKQACAAASREPLPWSAAASIRIFGAGHVGVALPAATPALQQAANPRVLGHLAVGGQCMGP